jgi:hypothetical protein
MRTFGLWILSSRSLEILNAERVSGDGDPGKLKVGYRIRQENEWVLYLLSKIQNGSEANGH